MSNLIKNGLQIVIGGGVLLAAVAWLSGGFGDRIGHGDASPVTHAELDGAETALVTEEEAMVYEEVSGTIFSARHTTISSKILARIESIPVRAGDEIEAGTVVAILDSRDLGARLAASRERVRSATAAAELARSERDRVAGMHASNVASKRDLDRTDASLRMARAELERAKQNVADAEVGLSYSEIRSPVTGRVVDRLAEPGDTAAPGAPLLRVYDPGAMRLEAPVREGLAIRLTSGQSLRVRVEAIDLNLEGEIDEIVPAAEPGARTFLVKVRLPDEPRLFSGMFGRIAVPAGNARRLVVPARAVERIGQLEYATVVGQHGGLARRLVTTGPRLAEGRIEVLSGLAASERVVLR
jgi:membrane fusion protein (multidrug efflux system)